MNKGYTQLNGQEEPLDKMKAAWKRQTQLLEGKRLIDDEEIRRAMQTAPARHTRPLLGWRWAAAVVAAVLITGVAVWQWPKPQQEKVAQWNPTPEPSYPQPTLSEQLPESLNKNCATPPTPSTSTAVGRPHTGSLPTNTTAASNEEPPVPPAEEVLPPTTTEHDNATLLAQAVAEEQPTPLQFTTRAADTLVVGSNRLIHFGPQRRKSLSETLFEPLMASR